MAEDWDLVSHVLDSSPSPLRVVLCVDEPEDGLTNPLDPCIISGMPEINLLLDLVSYFSLCSGKEPQIPK